MNILIIDYREKRREKIKQILGENKSYKVSDAAEVTVSERKIISWMEGGKDACMKEFNEKNPDVVLLHASQNQSYSFNFLHEICHKKIVICFTGASSFPESVKNDCNTNPLHCCFSDERLTDCNSDNLNLTAIVKFIGSMTEYLELLQTDPHAASELLQKAKNVLQNFNVELEAALNDLASELRTKLLSGNPLNHDVDQLILSRDEKFRKLQPR